MNPEDPHAVVSASRGRLGNLRLIYRPSVFLLAVSAVATLACYLAAGATLGLFLGGFFVATFLVPAAAVTSGKLIHVLDGAAAIVIGIGMIWLVAVIKSAASGAEWLLVVLTLASYALALAGLGRMLARLGINHVMVNAAGILIGFAWLTWPVWLAPHLGGSDRAVNILVSIHPPLAANGILSNEPPWTERTIAYQLTNLNQDVPLRLPTSAAPCIVFHLMLGAGLLGMAAIPKQLR